MLLFCILIKNDNTMNKILLISVFFLLIIGNAKSQESMSSKQLKANKEVALNLSKAIMGW